MLLIPAIDIKDGKCVRLRQGKMEEETVFSEDPIEVAAKWAAMGAQRLHLIDLDGAIKGKPVNKKIVQEIAQNHRDIDIQVGGGIRDEVTIQEYLAAGANYCILGSQAIRSPHFLADACLEYPGHIIAGIDVKDGKAATDGWKKISHYDAISLAQRFAAEGAVAIIFTDILRDGMMQGINLASTVELARNVNVPVIASGGVSGLQDIEALCKVADEGIMGVVIGRALYEGSIDFKQAVILANRLSGNP